MKNSKINTLSLLVGAIALLSGACTEKVVPQPPAQAMDPIAAATGAQKSELVIIDVRPLAVARKGMPTAAQPVPAAELETALAKISRKKPIVILCDDAPCAEAAANRAGKIGYKASFLKSFAEWEKAGLAVRRNW